MGDLYISRLAAGAGDGAGAGAGAGVDAAVMVGVELLLEVLPDAAAALRRAWNTLYATDAMPTTTSTGMMPPMTAPIPEDPSSSVLPLLLPPPVPGEVPPSSLTVGAASSLSSLGDSVLLDGTLSSGSVALLEHTRFTSSKCLR